MKPFFTICLIATLFYSAFGQQKKPAQVTPPGKSLNIKGKVLTETDTPIQGIKVTVYKTSVSTVTNGDGAFTIKLNTPNDTLMFSGEGFKNKGVILHGKKEVTVKLESEGIAMPSVSQIEGDSLKTDTLKANASGKDSLRTAVKGPDSLKAKIAGDTLKPISPPAVKSDTLPKAPADSLATAATSDTTATGPKVTGTVTSGSGKEPIPGASVVIKNTTKGVITDVSGAYTIFLNSPGDVLVYSFVGLENVEVPVNGQSIIDVNLKNEAKVLKEVVVVGYGTMNRSTLTSSVSSIGSSALENDPLPSVTQAIQGKAGGVQVTQKSGSPGGGISIRIRGTTSINASSDPLYVVDGVPVNSTTNFTGGSDFNFGGGTQGINILASINPSDIESVEILKDAAATSIYGARAANGVVLITTKRGKANSSSISLSAYSGVSQVPQERKYKMMKTDDYISYMTDYYAYKGTPVPAQILNRDADTDWQDEIFRTAPIQSYELSASGGADKTQYYTSIGYYDQQGTILNSGFNRLSARLNLDHQQSEKLKFSTNINVTRATNKRIQEENSKEGSTKNGIVAPPNIPVYNEDGTYAFDNLVTSRENPVAMLQLPVNNAETFRILGNISAEYQIIKGLNFKTNFGADMSYIDENFFMPPNGIRFVASSKGLGGARSSKDQLWLNENTLTYNNVFGNHSINILAGNSFQESKFTYVDARRTNFATNDIPVISAGGVISGASATIQEWAIVSYFSRLNYGYKNKYLFTANFRIDGSSRFGADNKYGTFPSFAAAWRVSEEDFLNNASKISNLKLRASWGLTGNQNIPNYASYSLYSGGNNYLNQPGFIPSTFGDPNLGWETTKQTDIGIDLGLLNERISILADYYVKNTSDLLINVQIPRTTGFQNTYKNIGEIQNKGFEFELSTKNIQSSKEGGFMWTTSLNMTFNRNKVVSLPNGDLFGGLGGTLNLAREGLPLGSFYGWEMVGVNPQTGVIDFAKNDETVGPPSDPNDRKIIGNPNPDFFGGITNNFYFKGFDLSIMGQFTYGNDIFNYNQFSLLSGSSDSNNGSTDWNRRWRQPGDITDVPRPTPGLFDNATISSRFVEDGSFFRIRNITLGYSLPGSVLDRLKVKSLRIYATVQNAYVFTKYKGYDPEVSSSIGGINPGIEYGFDYGSYPQPRIFTGGINLTF